MKITHYRYNVFSNDQIGRTKNDYISSSSHFTNFGKIKGKVIHWLKMNVDQIIYRFTNKNHYSQNKQKYRCFMIVVNGSQFSHNFPSFIY